MKKINCASILSVSLCLLFGSAAGRAAEKPPQQFALLKVNKAYDKRTAVKKSLIPNAGNGLFAVTKIKKGEVIGELGGRLVAENDYPPGNHYIASIAECAWKESHPYKYLDSKDHGANVSRINFAPSKINGVDSHFQNAKTKQLCQRPYFVFVAVRDIAAGEEIWSTYGPNYDYDRFMKSPAVRDFFCGRLKIDCREKYTYAH